MRTRLNWLLAGLLIGQLSFIHATAQVIVYEKQKKPVMQVAVFVPDTVETFASRYDKEKTQLGTAQSIIEQNLLESGFGVVPLNLRAAKGQIPTRAQVQGEAMAAGADYLIYGETAAGRILGSESGSIGGGRSTERPFGDRQAEWGHINQTEQSASVNAQIIRVSDGRIMAVENAASSGSARAKSGGVQGSITDAAQRLTRTLIPELEDIQRQQNRETKRQVIGLD